MTNRKEQTSKGNNATAVNVVRKYGITSARVHFCKPLNVYLVDLDGTRLPNGLTGHTYSGAAGKAYCEGLVAIWRQAIRTARGR